MSCTLVGNMSVATLNPSVALGLGPAGAQLSANVTAALALQAQASIGAPSLTVQLAAMENAIASLQAGIALGLPGVTFSVSAAATLVAQAQAALGNLQILLGQLGASVYVYHYSGGTVSTLGSDISSGVSGSPPPGLSGSTAVSGILIGAQASVWSANNAYFGGL